MMLHEVEKRAISSTQRLLQPGLARAWLRRTPRGLSVCLYGAADDALCAGALIVSSLRECIMTTGTVSSAGTLAGWFVMVKDNVGRFPGNKLWGDGWGWSWFDATNPQKTTSTDYYDCQSCHVLARQSDWIYTHGYPVLTR